MKTLLPYLLSCLLLLPIASRAQQGLEYTGQLSLWSSYSPDSDFRSFSGGRYLPELSYAFGKEDTQEVAFELSGNVFGNAFTLPASDSLTTFSTQQIRPYRAFVRYSTAQLEIRAGLQKISFGSASILRPLMWFDQIDPRDPLQITNGVYGVLGRYYFLNNANIWVWGLYGNDQIKGWEAAASNGRIPEFGGRVQYPVKQGEIALSYHRRVANAESLPLPDPSLKLAMDDPDRVVENRIGLDGKWDLKVGLWVEASYTQTARPIMLEQNNTTFSSNLNNQLVTNLGVDYTFGLGNGLNVKLEHLIFASGATPQELAVNSNLIAGTISYPFGMFSTISGVVFLDWQNEALINFLNYQYQFPTFTLNIMGYLNPQGAQFVQQNAGANPFGGKGVQVMLVFNH